MYTLVDFKSQQFDVDRNKKNKTTTQPQANGIGNRITAEAERSERRGGGE